MADKKEKAGASKKDAAPAKGAAPTEAKPAAEAKKAGGKAAAPAKSSGSKEMPKGVAQGPLPKDYVPRLKKHYEDVVRPALIKEFGYENPMEVPRIEKIVLNMGVGEAVQDSKKIEAATRDLSAITGQRPVVTRAKKSIATFKVRENMPLGCKVTLRRDRMYEFLDRLITIALPRVRDFRGVNGKSFDGRGNFALGLKEQLVFPEIVYDKVDTVRGMDIVICTTAKTDKEAKALLKGFQMPFSN